MFRSLRRLQFWTGCSRQRHFQTFFREPHLYRKTFPLFWLCLPLSHSFFFVLLAQSMWTFWWNLFTNIGCNFSFSSADAWLPQTFSISHSPKFHDSSYLVWLFSHPPFRQLFPNLPLPFPGNREHDCKIFRLEDCTWDFALSVPYVYIPRRSLFSLIFPSPFVPWEFSYKEGLTPSVQEDKVISFLQLQYIWVWLISVTFFILSSF